MRRGGIVTLFAAAAAAVVVMVSPSAWAAPSSVQDGNDVNGGLDIRSVHADDDSSGVTWHLQTYDTFGDAGWVCDILLDWNNDADYDSYVQFFLEWGQTALVYRGGQAESVASGSVQRASSGAIGSTPSNTVRVRVSDAALTAAGMPQGAESLSYAGACEQWEPNVEDETSFVRHELDDASTGDPGPEQPDPQQPDPQQPDPQQPQPEPEPEREATLLEQLIQMILDLLP